VWSIQPTVAWPTTWSARTSSTTIRTVGVIRLRMGFSSISISARGARGVGRPPAAASRPPDDDPDTDSGATGWQDGLLETLLALTPDAFERLAQRLLREAGFL